ncbi:MAG: glycoside hydrolase family 44 protein [Bacteroidota bacterium]
MLRENGGNNATKYNWRRKLSSHPDWYNNVYPHDWDFAVQSLYENLPGVQGMWAFQLIGKSAATTEWNFDDWNYNGSQWWSGVTNNWAGGGGPSSGDGDPNLYLTDWPADSTVAILPHWFSENGLGLDGSAFRYWSMDNEADVWYATHDDVMPVQPSIEDFLQRYFEVAKKARALFGDIRLVGPVATNEWQWYNWADAKIQSGGKSYTYLEYFIKRAAEEESASGLRLLDVVDLHFYPSESKTADILQLHRVWFDEGYDYPGANGVKRAGTGDWDESIRSEHVFARCREWLDEYFGTGHGIGLGISEMGIQGDDPNVTATWYASTLGVFADEGVELFTPWYWKTGMWEVLHLFARYTRPFSIPAQSTRPETVSAHATLNASGDSLTLMLINRSESATEAARVQLANFNAADGWYQTLQLHDLPAEETFISHADNALSRDSIRVENTAISITLPALSVTAVLLHSTTATAVSVLPAANDLLLEVYPQPSSRSVQLRYHVASADDVSIALYDLQGRQLALLHEAYSSAGDHELPLDLSSVAAGSYIIRISTGVRSTQTQLRVLR